MKQEKKRPYETPAMTVVEFKTELGFASSGSVTATRGSYGNNDGQGAGGNNNQQWF